MNFREGTRRLALLLGMMGAIVSGFASYLLLRSALEQRASHTRFERLAASDALRQERNCRLLGHAGGCSLIKLPPGYTLNKPEWNPVDEARKKYPGLKDWSDAQILKNLSDPAKFRSAFPQYASLPDDTIKKNIARLSAPKDAIDEFIALPRDKQLTTLQRLSPDRQDKLLAKIKERRASTADDSIVIAPKNKPEDGKDVIESADGTPLDSEVNKGGIKTIHWTKDYAVRSIETENGYLYPTPTPNAWEYALILFFPVFGFLIPWCAVRAIGWVGAGFIQSPK